MFKFFEFLTVKELRSRIYFTLALILLYRFGSHLPIPSVNSEILEKWFNQDGLLGFFNLFSGGGFSRFSVFALGILPFINASIIMQLLTIMYPKLKEIAEEGESGRKQLAQYTRYLAIILSFVQAIFTVLAIQSQGALLPGTNAIFFTIYAVTALVAGATLVMWLGEVITEFGIGNGASLLIFVGILSAMPNYIRNTAMLIATGTSIIGVIVMVTIFIGMVVSIVVVQEGQRKVPVQYAKRIVGRKMYGGQNTFIPLRLIQGGVMPIIFASAVLQFPLMLTQYINIEVIQNFFANHYRYDGFWYNFFFCFLIFFFTYFYTAITFNPQELGDTIKKYGGFILGVRPGAPTVAYLEKIVSKLTLIGAFFLAFVAMVPILGANLTKVTSFMGLGGTALLIIVGVGMDLVKQIETFLISRKYEGLLQ